MWTVSEARINPKTRNLEVFLCKEKIEKRVSCIISDINLQVLQKNRSLFQRVYPQLVLLSDGSQKLYLRLKLLGGMVSDEDKALAQQLGINDPQITDKIISQKIKSQLPAKTYTAVTVQSIPFKFPFTEEEKPSRMISLNLGIKAKFLDFFRGIGATLCLIDPKAYGTTDDGNAIMSAMLGSNNDNDVKELKRAYQKGSKLTLIVSNDLQRIHIKFDDSIGNSIYTFFH